MNKYCIWCSEPSNTSVRACPAPDGDGHLFSLNESFKKVSSMNQVYHDDRLSYTDGVLGMDEFITDDFGNAHILTIEQEGQNLRFFFDDWD